MNNTYNIGIKINIILHHLLNAKNKITDEKWWKDIIIIDWKNIRGSVNTRWISIKYKPVDHDQPVRLNVIINNELHIGQIMPKNVEDVMDLRTKTPDIKVETRQTKPSIQIQKWSKMVKTQEDKITPLQDEAGNYIYPEDKYLSKYFQYVTLIDEIFKYELEERIERGQELMSMVKDKKKDNSDIVIEFIKKNQEGKIIIQDSDLKLLKDKIKQLPQKLISTIIVNNSIKVFSSIQEYISEKSVINNGLKLSNPIARITINFDTKTDEAITIILDKTKVIENNMGKRAYGVAMIDDTNTVNANNIHKLIQSKSIIDGIVCMDAICLSQLGISLPIKFTTMIITPPAKKEIDIYNICNIIDENNLQNNNTLINNYVKNDDSKQDDSDNNSDNDDLFEE